MASGIRFTLAIALLIGVSACGSSPTAPTTTTTTATKIISVSGNLSFGNVNVGSSSTLTFTISNSGTAAITVTALSVTGGTGTAGVVSSFTVGSIAAGTTQPVTITFTPTIAQTYSGTITVVGDQTSGNGSISFSGVGINNSPLFTMSGAGNAVFTMPSTVTKLDITASYGSASSNFIVWVGSATSACGVIPDGSCRLLVNALMGTLFGQTTYDSGTIQTGGGGTVSVENSVGVSWSMIEIR